MGQVGGTGGNLLGERVQLGAQGGAFGVAGIKLGLDGSRASRWAEAMAAGDGVQQDLVLLLARRSSGDLVLLLAERRWPSRIQRRLPPRRG